LRESYKVRKFGCTDPAAANFDPEADVSDGWCTPSGSIGSLSTKNQLDRPKHDDKKKKKKKVKDEDQYIYSNEQRMHPDDALTMYRIGHILGELLDRHDIVWWATDGTLLGSVRNRGIIPHDDDIDYAVLLDQVEDIHKLEFLDDLHRNGLHLVDKKQKDRIYIWDWKSYNETNGKTRKSKHGSRMKVDLWPLKHEEGKGWHYIEEDHKHLYYPDGLCVGTKEFDKLVGNVDSNLELVGRHTQNWHCALRKTVFGSSEVWTPSQAVSEEFLTARYRDANWRTSLRCEATLHGCTLIKDVEHDLHGMSLPSEPLIEAI
jgi:hypothetical protein